MITSVEAHRAGPGFAIYSAMKAALANLAQSLALELADRGIRVNCVAPDMITTEGDALLADASGASSEAAWDQKPLPDDGHPDDVAAAVLYLVTDLGRFVTGTTIHVDGGTHAAGGWKRRRSDGRWVL
jgi:NAD(P)-dependent dehydrogenase (short-subunit alcohol dehydrogenase family)